MNSSAFGQRWGGQVGLRVCWWHLSVSVKQVAEEERTTSL